MTTTTHPVDRLLVEISEGHGISTEHWTAEAHLDATVPGWRFECRGADAVAAQLSSWYDVPATIESAVRRPFPGGEALELDLSFVQDGVPHAVHQVHLLTVGPDGISSDIAFCGGRWPAPLLAEMLAETEAARGR